MSSSEQPNFNEFITNAPDIKHLEMIGRLLLSRGRNEHEVYGNTPGLFEYHGSRLSEQVTHIITAQNSTFKSLEVESSRPFGFPLLALTHTEHKIVPHSELPRQTVSYRAQIGSTGSLLKISHGVGRFSKHRALAQYDAIALDGRDYSRHLELQYFTNCIETFIELAGIDITKANRGQNE